MNTDATKPGKNQKDQTAINTDANDGEKKPTAVLLRCCGHAKRQNGVFQQREPQAHQCQLSTILRRTKPDAQVPAESARADHPHNHRAEKTPSLKTETNTETNTEAPRRP